VAAPTGSAWITAAQTSPSTGGNYHYQFAFALGDEWTGRPCTLSLRWAVDDEVQFRIDNLAPFFSTPNFGAGPTGSNHTALHGPITMTVGPGAHVLDVNVQNGGAGASNGLQTGLLLVGNIQCKCNGGIIVHTDTMSTR
jgi:hypothetical protein